MALNLQSIMQIEGVFDRELSSISIQQELIYIYKKLYDFQMGITKTHATSSSYRMMLPQIVYKDIIVSKCDIYFFLKKLVKSKKKIFKDNEEINQEFIEHLINHELNNLLIYYNLKNEDTSYFFRILGMFLQPIHRLKEYFREKNLIRNLETSLAISTKHEALERIVKIFENIEIFLKKILNSNSNLFPLNHPVILLIYAAYMTTKQIIKGNVRFLHYLVLLN